MLCSNLIIRMIAQHTLIAFPENDLGITMESRLAEGVEGSVWDLTTDNILLPNSRSKRTAAIGRVKRLLPEYVKHELGEGFWWLTPGHYLVKSLETISMPLELSGMVIPRSSVFRAGLIPTGTRIAPGYSGNIVTGLYVPEGLGISIERGARLMSVAFDKIDLPERPFASRNLSSEEVALTVGRYDGIWCGSKITTDGVERAF